MWWNRWPSARIGLPTGEKFFVVDVDRLEALGELEAELPATWTVETPRAGLHYYFAAVEGVTNSPGNLPKGIDVRGRGGYVIAPPSDGYNVVDRTPMDEAPNWLLGLIRAPRKPEPEPLRRERKTSSSPSKAIPNGSRNGTLFFVALDLKDGGASARGVLDGLLEENRRRCDEPLEESEVERIATSASRYPIRSGNQSPELREAVGRMMALRRVWGWRGTGGQSDRDVLRVLLEGAIRYGALNPDGSVDFSMSVRSVALLASVNYVTVSRSSTRRLEEAGWVEKIPGEGPRDAATWRLRLPARGANTLATPPPPCRVLAVLAPPDETPTWRFRGLLGKGAGFVEELLEAHGPMTVEEIAEVLGSRPRDVRRSYLRDDGGERHNTLEARGLAEELDDGRWSLVAGHVEKVAEIKAAKYSVKLRRERFETDPITGVREYLPDVYGRSLSEDEREEKDRETHDRHREDYRAELIRRELERRADEDEATIAATPDLLAASRVGRMLMCNGWRREGSREWANLTTGEALPIDRAMEKLREEMSA
jgi:hypothetical protein